MDYQYLTMLLYLQEKQNKDKSVTMEYFIETSHLDTATADMLRKYDKSGVGTFSKDEVVSIILDLRETLRKNEILGNSNKLFKRLLFGSIGFIVLLLASMFGLSYAVAALTANTEVQNDGTLLAKNTDTAISTDSRAIVHEVTASNEQYCLMSTEVAAIKDEVLAGKNVVMQINDSATSLEQLFASGSKFDENQACFWVPEKGKHDCFNKVTDGQSCVPPADRRLGSEDMTAEECRVSEFSCTADCLEKNNYSYSCWVWSWP